jgi:hypothetical protein
MSKYFDKFDSAVRELARSGSSDEEFLTGLVQLESNMIHNLELLTGDWEVYQNSELVKSIQEIVARTRTRYAGGDFMGDHLGACDVTSQNLACRSSQLSCEMHQLFHQIAAQQIRFRWGRLTDNPQSAVQARDRWDATHAPSGKKRGPTGIA